MLQTIFRKIISRKFLLTAFYIFGVIPLEVFPAEATPWVVIAYLVVESVLDGLGIRSAMLKANAKEI